MIRQPGAATLAAALAIFSLVARADDFVPGFTDLPLMPGLTAAEPGPVLFDKPGGRIVEAAARGGSPERVAEFYRATLPQLGWVAATGGGHRVLSYRREGEALRIETGGDGTVRFFLSPR